MRVYLESLGCKLNQCERDTLARQFAQAGHTVVSRPEEAELCVVNTCAVTHVAAGKSRRRFNLLRRLNPDARLVATGCYTGLEENGLQADMIVTNEHKFELVALVEAHFGSPPVIAPAYPPPVSRTRPLVKIQDGCDNACTYCIVHILRGPQRSRPRDEILAEVEELVRQGYQEVVLTGVHIGAYGSDCGDDLAGLVQAILNRTPLARLRLSSIEPWDLNPEFFALWQDPRLCRHLHLPLQSGCDATLQRMERRYTTAQFADLVARAREAVPDIALTTDVIVGFPGESEREFAISAGFVRAMGFARVHVFPYSPRPGTPAATMPDQVPPPVRRQRAQQMREIARRSADAFRRRFLGHTLSVLWETRRADGLWSGLSDNYLRFLTRSEENLHNTIRPALAVEVKADGLRGELLPVE